MKQRRVLDAEGRPVTEVQGPMGRFTVDVDMDRVRALAGDQLDVAETARMVRSTFPYGERATKSGKSMKQRSSLDYMRALRPCKEIKVASIARV